MNAQTILEMFGLFLGGGGGASLIAKLTRLAVAVEQVAESNKTLVKQVGDHEARLTKGGL